MLRIALSMLPLAGLMASCGPRACHGTMLEVQARARQVEAPVVAVGATVELGFVQTERLGCDGSLHASALYPRDARVVDGSVVQLVERRPRSLVVRGLRPGETELVLVQDGAPMRVGVAAAAPAHALLGTPLAGVRDAGDVAWLAGATLELPVALRDVRGRAILGADIAGLTRVEGSEIVAAGELAPRPDGELLEPLERGLVLRAGTAPGVARVSLLDAEVRTTVVAPSEVAVVELDPQLDDTSAGYGCIPPAPALGAPVSTIGSLGTYFLIARARTHDERFVVGVPRPISETPDTCTVIDPEHPARVAEVVDFHLPFSRGYQRTGWELARVAPGTCRVVLEVGDARASIEIAIAE